MLFLGMLVLTAAAAAFLAIPFLREESTAPREDGAVDALKRQIDGIRKDVEDGDLDTGGAAEDRAYLERKLLDTVESAPTPVVRARGNGDRAVAIGVVATVVLGGVLLYAVTGKPQADDAQALPSLAAGPAAGGASNDLPDVDTMIEKLARRMEKEPGDAEGWRMLGWSYFQTRRYPEAVKAYDHARALQPRNAGYVSALAEAKIMASRSRVDAETLALLREAARLDPRDERAQFYMGLERSESGDAAGALDIWLVALARSPESSEWRAQFRDHAVSLAKAKGIDISRRLPATQSAAPAAVTGDPTPEAMSQVRALNPGAQQAAITGMVEGLDGRLRQSPHDEDGWVRLMRARMVLEQVDRARDARDRALSAFASDRAAQSRLLAAARDLGVPD